MPEIEKKETRTETRMNAIETGIKEIKEQLERLSKKLTRSETKEKEQMDRIIKIESICTEYIELKKEMNEMKIKNIDLQNKVTKLEEDQRWRERNKIKNMIEIYGIPKQDGEIPKKIITQLARSAKVELGENDIEECYRVSARDGTAKQIVAKLKEYAKKSELTKAMKNKKPRLSDINRQPENKYIYVNEMLTKEMKQILYKAKQEVIRRKWYKIWIYAGDVYILQEENGRKIKIENLEQLETLLR